MVYPKVKYGDWAGRPDGSKYQEDYCAYDVWGQWMSHQCSRKKGHGINGLFCKQHGKMVTEKMVKE